MNQAWYNDSISFSQCLSATTFEVSLSVRVSLHFAAQYNLASEEAKAH